MRGKLTDARVVWLAIGLISGLLISYFWPHEPVYAATADRNSQFAMATVGVNLIDPIEGVFVVDFLTGSLRGAVLNRQAGRFTAFYYRDLAKDFNVDPQSEPHYAFVSGQAQLAGRGGVTFSSGVLYVGELSSGKIACYAFPWKETPVPSGVTPLLPIDVFQFREPTQK
jgi:hypothetical protein